MPLLIQSNTRPFDSAGTSLRDVPAALRMTVAPHSCKNIPVVL